MLTGSDRCFDVGVLHEQSVLTEMQMHKYNVEFVTDSLGESGMGVEFFSTSL